MDSPELISRLRKSKKFHNELRESNRLKEDKEDSILRYGEKIQDKDSRKKVPTNELGFENSDSFKENPTEYQSLENKRDLLTKSELQRAEEYRKLLQSETQLRKEKELKMIEEMEKEKSLDRGVLNEYIKKDLDLFYVNKIIKGILTNVARFDEFEVLKEDYGKLVAYVVRMVEK